MCALVMSDPAAATAVTVIFALVLVHAVVRAVVAFGWVDRVSNLVHAVMAVVMLAMPWSWYAVFPVAAQIAFFTAATFWYLYLALFRPSVAAAPATDHHRHPAVLVYHAVMMLAMVWMAVAMTPVAAASGMDDMGGMSMGHGTDSMPMTGSADWALVITWAFGLLFVVAALWFLIAALRRAITATRLSGHAGIVILDTLATALMAAGMACSFLLLMT
jgi:Domain of unknown function (DUF5134)